MSRLFRSALMVTAASMAVGLLVNPTAAYADDATTKLSKAEMVTAMKAVATTSTAAAKGGWRATMAIAGGSFTGSVSFVVDPVGGVAFDEYRFPDENGTEYAVQRKGTYGNLSDATSRSAVKMMGRPSVRYVFTADKSLLLADYVNDTMPTPANVLNDDVEHAGTKTIHDDGSTDYAYEGKGETSVTLHVDSAGVLAVRQANGDGFKTTLTYAYGAQHVTLPSAAVTVDAVTLAKAKAYLTMPASVQKTATKGASHTRTAAKGKKVKVASLRKIVRKDAAAVNKALAVTLVKTKNIAGGIRVYATNPWTHKTVAYTVKASKKKVVVKKA